MKDGANSVQCYSDSRTASFRNLSSQCQEQRFNVLPVYPGMRRSREDGLKGSTMPSPHGHMISHHDITLKLELSGGWEAG